MGVVLGKAEAKASVAEKNPIQSISSAEASNAIVQNLIKRVNDINYELRKVVHKDNVIANIIMSDEDIRLTAANISIVGKVTIGKWIEGVTGNKIDEDSITTIDGNVITSGIIRSFSWLASGGSEGSQFDLDNGTISLGGYTAPKFHVSTLGILSCTGADFNGGTITAGTVYTGAIIADSYTYADKTSEKTANDTLYVGSTDAGLVRDRAAAGNTHSLTTHANIFADVTTTILAGAGAKVLKGITTLDNTGSLVFDYNGSILAGSGFTINSFGVVTAGYGVAMTQDGLVGVNNGVVTFAINSTTGDATFGGDITSAATITGSTITGGIISGGTVSGTVGEFNGVKSESTKGAWEFSHTILGVTANIRTTILGSADIATASTYDVGVVGRNLSISASKGHIGVAGILTNSATADIGIGVYGYSPNSGHGVLGQETDGVAVSGLVTHVNGYGGEFTSSAVGGWSLRSNQKNFFIGSTFSNSPMYATGLWPRSGNFTGNVGSDGNAWAWVYSDKFRWKTDAIAYDSMDDLAVLASVKPKKDKNGNHIPGGTKGGYVADVDAINDILVNRDEIIEGVRKDRKVFLEDLLLDYEALIKNEDADQENIVIAEADILKISSEIKELTDLPEANLSDYHTAVADDTDVQITSQHTVSVNSIKNRQFYCLEDVMAMVIGGINQLNNETTLLVENLNSVMGEMTVKISNLEKTKIDKITK